MSIHKTSKFNGCNSVEDCYEKLKDHYYNTGERMFSIVKDNDDLYKRNIIGKLDNKWNRVINAPEDSEEFHAIENSFKDAVKKHKLGVIRQNWIHFKNNSETGSYFLFNFTTRHVFSVNYEIKGDVITSNIDTELEF